MWGQKIEGENIDPARRKSPPSERDEEAEGEGAVWFVGYDCCGDASVFVSLENDSKGEQKLEF